VTTEDLSGGEPRRGAPSGAVPAPPVVREVDVAAVRDVDFPIALRGYDRDAVDAYVCDVNRIIAELQVGRSPQSAIRHALDQVSDETRGILERAHETADEITARSRSQADDRLQWAEREAREAIQAATIRVQELDADAEKVWEERHRLIEDVARISADLATLAESASARFPAEPESATTPLPELPGPGPRFGDPIEGHDDETRERPPDPGSAVHASPPPPPDADDSPPAAGPR
jgi:DivIVA domain-containing protein